MRVEPDLSKRQTKLKNKSLLIFKWPWELAASVETEGEPSNFTHTKMIWPATLAHIMHHMFLFHERMATAIVFSYCKNLQVAECELRCVSKKRGNLCLVLSGPLLISTTLKSLSLIYLL